jgi:hypothetical protein
MKTLIMLVLFTSLSCAQPKGTINGHPIADKVFDYPPRQQVETMWQVQNRRPVGRGDHPAIDAQVQARRCNSLSNAIRLELRDEQIGRLGVTVTDADIADVKTKIRMAKPEDEARSNNEYARLVLAALDAVKGGEDSQAVYNRMLKPLGMQEQSWQIEAIQGQTEAGRKMLQERLTMTAESVRQSQQRFDWAWQARYRKLDKTVDELLSRSDPKYREYVAEFPVEGNPQAVVLPQAHADYVQKARAEYWRKVGSEAQILINDPTMKSCDLSAFGVALSKPR